MPKTTGVSAELTRPCHPSLYVRRISPGGGTGGRLPPPEGASKLECHGENSVLELTVHGGSGQGQRTVIDKSRSVLVRQEGRREPLAPASLGPHPRDPEWVEVGERVSRVSKGVDVTRQKGGSGRFYSLAGYRISGTTPLRGLPRGVKLSVILFPGGPVATGPLSGDRTETRGRKPPPPPPRVVPASPTPKHY